WDWDVTDDMTLTVGGRWSESDKSASRTEYVFTDVALSAMLAGADRCFILGPGVGPDDQPECLTTLSIPGQGDVPLPPTVTEAADGGSWSNFSPKLGASYRIDDDLMIYGYYSQGFRDGGVEGAAANFRKFDREKLHAFEVGLKSDWSDGRLRVNAALFYYDYQDLQIELSQLVDNLVFTSVFNAGEAALTGAEIESTWQPNEMLQLSLNVGWLDSEITELDRSDPSVDFGFVREGNEFGQAPAWTASLVPVVFFPLTRGSLTWRGEINYSASYFQDFANGGFADETDAQILTGANIANGVPPADAVVTPGTLIDSERLDSRVLVNTSLSYLSDDGRVELAIWARNLFEEEYTVNREFVNGLVYTNALYGAPRTYGANVSFRF
ncbi:MAG: TonB-dependent receptor domain-containing protein, partial [Gammaproteobacteria bacterium]